MRWSVTQSDVFVSSCGFVLFSLVSWCYMLALWCKNLKKNLFSKKLSLFFFVVSCCSGKPMLLSRKATGRLWQTGGDSECFSMFPLSASSPLSDGGIEVRKELREGTTERKDKECKPPQQHLKYVCIIDEETKRNIYLSLWMCRGWADPCRAREAERERE